jgi:predicted metal-dependent peptidase
MQFSPDHGTIDDALEELQAVLTLEVLRINYQHRKRRHMRRKHIQRQIMLLKAEALRDRG